MGKVKSISHGAVNAVVEIELTGRPTITAVVTEGAVDELGLVEGGDACAVIKASSVMVGVCGEGSGGCGCQPGGAEAAEA